MYVVTKIYRDDRDHSYTEVIDPNDKQEPVKRYLNLRKSDPAQIAGSGQFKVAKIIKKVSLATGMVTEERYVRNVVRNPKNGITTEPLIFAKIEASQGPAKANVLHGTIFAYTKKSGEQGVAIFSKYYPKSFKNLSNEMKRQAMPQIAAAIAHLHDLGIVHCDINEKNILLTEANEPVLCDVEGALLFDLTTHNLDKEFKRKRVVKQPIYMHELSPPEIQKYRGPNFDALDFTRAKKWDMFAFGLLVNKIYNLAIEVDTPPSNFHYVDLLSELPVTDKDYHEYRLPSEIQNSPLADAVLKCLQGQKISWEEILPLL